LHDDNILNNLEELSDTAIKVAPNFAYLGLISKHKILFSYKGDYAVFTNDNNLNYNNHKLAAGAQLDHSHRMSTEFKLGFDQLTEEPGSTNASTIALTEFNEYKNKSALGRFYYGQKTSTGQVVLEYKYANRDYTNNNQAFRNVDNNQLTGTFFYRIAPKTRMLFQASVGDYGYDDQVFQNGLVFNQSSTENLYLAGVEWDATAKTTGIFKIGYQDKDYDDVRFNDISGLSYMLDMIWKPNTYTRITLGAARQTTESAQLNVGGFISTSYSIDVSHDIRERTTLMAKYNLSNDDIVTSSTRTDKRNGIDLAVKHSLREWLDIKLAYTYQEKSSSIDLFNFESNTIELSLTTALD
jgi:hypothetical protein